MKPTPGWYPVKLLAKQDGSIQLRWQNFTGVPFVEPFFEDTMRKAVTGRDYLETTLQGLREFDLGPGITPTAFVFHTSRSGSTLLTQMIANLEGGVVLSEPPVIDDLLQSSVPEDEKVGALRDLIRVLSQRRTATDRAFILKFDCWHLPYFPLIQQAFPDVPCCFLYRNPVAILWSHHRQRGSQMVPGLRPTGLLAPDVAEVHPADLDAYAARVLEALFHEAIPFVEAGRLLPVDHQRLLLDPFQVIAQLGLWLETDDLQLIQERIQFHSKRPGEPYQAEEERLVPDAVREHLCALAAKNLVPMYEAISKQSFNWSADGV